MKWKNLRGMFFEIDADIIAAAEADVAAELPDEPTSYVRLVKECERLEAELAEAKRKPNTLAQGAIDRLEEANVELAIAREDIRPHEITRGRTE